MLFLNKAHLKNSKLINNNKKECNKISLHKNFKNQVHKNSPKIK